MSDMLTFIGGAAVGSLITYLSKNEEARKSVEHFIDSMGSAFTDFVKRVTPGESKQAEASETETTAEVADKPPPAKRTTRPRKATKPKKPLSEESAIH